ncbi:phosphoglycerate dehydrogenase [Pseudolactococcus yaeyamensis]
MIAMMREMSKEKQQHYETLFSEELLSVDKQLSKAYPEVDILISEPNVTPEFLAHFPNLKLIFTLSAGVNKMPFEYLKANQIILTNSRGLHAEHMSEHALAMILAQTRQINLAVKNQVQHHWAHNEGKFTTVHGKTLCVVGAGAIGNALARKAIAMGMQVTGVSRTGRQQENYQTMYPTDKLIEAVATADIVVLLLPLTPETYHLFDNRIFSAIKKGSALINLSRGGTVDETALIAALTNGQVGFAGLDVFKDEPLGSESVFWDMPNVLITPHVAGDISDYLDRALTIFTAVLTDFRNGTAVRNRVDLDLGY